MSSAFVQQLKSLLGPQGWLDGEDAKPFLADSFASPERALWVARPANTEKVTAVVKHCADAGKAIVPQGGNSNVCNMAVPLANQEVVVISLARMRQIIEVDPECSTLNAQAGCIVEDVQNAAIAHDHVFAPDWGARGSAMVGGAVATNGGG